MNRPYSCRAEARRYKKLKLLQEACFRFNQDGFATAKTVRRADEQSGVKPPHSIRKLTRKGRVRGTGHGRGVLPDDPTLLREVVVHPCSARCYWVGIDGVGVGPARRGVGRGRVGEAVAALNAASQHAIDQARRG